MLALDSLLIAEKQHVTVSKASPVYKFPIRIVKKEIPTGHISPPVGYWTSELR